MNAERVAEQLVRWLRSETEAAKANGLVFGLSGGVDSAVVGCLVGRAFPDRHQALIMPIRSERQDLVDAQLVADSCRLNAHRFDLDSVYEAFARVLGDNVDSEDKPDLPLANLKARLRMVALYYQANKLRYLVVGTGNRSELSLGYFTKYGDGGVDLLPLGHLVKSEVRDLARHLGVPDRVIEKPPAAGIWRGLTDEGELGFSYSQLEDYLLVGDAGDGVKEKVEARRRANAHKLRTPKMPPPPASS